jgi:hypothetical protein
MRTKVVVTAVAIAALLGGAATSSASPGAGSLASADGAWIYMVTPLDGGTIVTRIRGSDRTAQTKRRLEGVFEVPVIAGVKDGVSQDGRTLVLTRHVGRATQFALLDTGTLRPRRMLTLRGTYDFDALAPDGSSLYVIRYFSGDAGHYAVQVLNLNRASVTPRTVVEKGEPGEAMAGRPVARAKSRDGNWVYTLYRRAGEAPFVHALSTAETFTVCIDLDNLAGRSDVAAMRLRLRPAGSALEVTAAGEPVARVDTNSFAVTTPLAPARAITQAPPSRPEDGKTPLWWLAAGAAGLALAAAAATAKHLQKRPDANQI